MPGFPLTLLLFCYASKTEKCTNVGATSILSIMPLVAIFILFDFVVHNPRHAETRDNLSLLEVAAGHFSLQEYKSKGVMPSSLVGEFAHIARQYVRDVKVKAQAQSAMPSRQVEGTIEGPVGAVVRGMGNNLV
jgi:hypothetical protein